MKNWKCATCGLQLKDGFVCYCGSDMAEPIDNMIAKEAEPLQQKAKVWCQYIAGMIDCYLQTMPDESTREAAISGIIERWLKHLSHITTSVEQA